MPGKQKRSTGVAVIGTLILMLILVAGTILMGQDGRRSTEAAVRSVSLLYLDELAGRREQVVENNLRNKIDDVRMAVNLMTQADLDDKHHLEAYQRRMKQLFSLDSFAFVDTDGLIYTSTGTQNNIDEFAFDYRTLTEPEISLFQPESEDRKVIIAVPVSVPFQGKTLSVCFMAIDMSEMLAGVSMDYQSSDATFSNLYTADGIPLSNQVLGGQATENNLLEALKNVRFENGYSYEQVVSDFAEGNRGVVSFVYGDVRETLSYVPVVGTDWLLTYLIRESVISEQISSISDGIIFRSVVQSLLTVAVLLVMFWLIVRQNRENAQLHLEKETSDVAHRVKQEELERQLALQEELLEQRQALNDALQTAEEANRAKTAFLSNMSHEIRTPMNAIIGLDNIALNDPQTPEKTREYLKKIDDSANHLLNLINDILDVSRIESGKMSLKNEEFSFSELLSTLNTMFSSQCAEKGLEYLCNIRGEVDDCYIGDKMKLRRILINILSNAVKFTPEGGRVELAVEQAARLDNQTTLLFTISDTGIGMSKEFLPTLFDAFVQENSSTTSRYGSTGLGMSITKSLVEMMNGDIEVDSEKGVGTTFRVKVTLMNTEQQDAGEEPVIRPNELTVLVVDDDPIACEHAKLVLEKAGIAVEIAASGAEAVEMVKLRHARRKSYNLILVDWQMPEMDGVEATRQMREIIGYESAIIILTAYRWDDVLEEALQAGVDSFLSKPLFISAIMDELTSTLKRRRQASERPENRADLNGRRILLAEDVQINAEIMMMILQDRGMEADLAVNGRRAVELFSEHEPGWYDAVLMDMRMPEMDGLEATRTIRAMDRPDAKTIPIIALTANAFDEDVQRSLQAGLNAHLSKPVVPENLYKTLESLIPA